MGESQELRDLDTADHLEKVRGDEYGQDAWYVSSRILEILPTNKLKYECMLSPVASIVRKLVRAANDPLKSEHWVDMEVYVRLLRKYTEQREEEHVPTALPGE